MSDAYLWLAAIQAFSTVVLVIITGNYAYHTKRLVELTHTCHLRPKCFEIFAAMWNGIVIKNYSNNDALGVLVIVKNVDDSMLVLKGSSAITSNDESIYTHRDLFPTSPTDRPPIKEILLRWETVSGETLMRRWQVMGDSSFYSPEKRDSVNMSEEVKRFLTSRDTRSEG